MSRSRPGATATSGRSRSPRVAPRSVAAPCRASTTATPVCAESSMARAMSSPARSYRRSGNVTDTWRPERRYSLAGRPAPRPCRPDMRLKSGSSSPSSTSLSRWNFAVCAAPTPSDAWSRLTGPGCAATWKYRSRRTGSASAATPDHLRREFVRVHLTVGVELLPEAGDEGCPHQGAQVGVSADQRDLAEDGLDPAFDRGDEDVAAGVAAAPDPDPAGVDLRPQVDLLARLAVAGPEVAVVECQRIATGAVRGLEPAS